MKKKVFSLMMTLVLAFMGVAHAQTALPYAYGFEEGMGDWTMVDCHASSGVSDIAASEGSYSFSFYYTTNPPQYLISPELAAPSGVTVGFDYRAYSDYYSESFQVGYSTTTNDVAAFTWGQEITTTDVAWHQYSTQCPAGTKYVAISCTSYDAWRLFVDNFTFDGEGGGGGSVVSGDLTVYDGTSTNNRIPAYVFYFDDFTRAQHVFPAADLADMNGGEIESVKWYTTSSNMPYTTVSQAVVYITEVGYTSISAYVDRADCQTVYTGTLEFTATAGGGECIVNFSTPYQYNGGNLLIGVDNLDDVGYKNIYFYGQTATGASIAGSNSTSGASAPATQQDFLPKTTFTYTTSGGGAAGLAMHLMHNGVMDTINLGALPGYMVSSNYPLTNGLNYEGPAWMHPVTVKMYNENTREDYKITVLDYSPNDSIFFYDYELPFVLHARAVDTAFVPMWLRANRAVTGTTVERQFVAIYENNSRLAALWPITADVYIPRCPDIWELALNWAPTSPADTINYPYSEQSMEGEDLHNDYTLPFPEIPEGYDAVYKLTIEDDQMLTAYVIGTNGKVALYAEDFNSGLPHDEVPGNAGPWNDNYYVGLPGGGNVVAPASELTVHDGTMTNGFVPVYGFYADDFLKCEMVYPASELTTIVGRDINSLTYYIDNSAYQAWTSTWQVFVKEVGAATISDFYGTAGATVVYQGTLDGTGSEMTINFTTPYHYNGGNLLVGVYNITDNGAYSSCSFLGETVTGASVQGTSYYTSLDEITPTQQDFLPKTTFGLYGGRNRDELTYSFDNDLEGWTNIDADGDGHMWYHSTEAGYHSTAAVTSHSGAGHLMGESYCNGLGALTPDDYLVSPQQYAISNGSTISFWACAQDVSYAAEHFGVAVSTTSNTNASAFTTIQEWTLTAKGAGDALKGRDNRATREGNWYQFTCDLSAYAGQNAWVAIRHFDCTDQFIIDLDDVTISGIGGGGTPTPPTPPTPSMYNISAGPEILNLPLAGGNNYYLVASSTDKQFGVVIKTDDMPCPQVAYGPTPADGAMGIEPGNVNLQWTLDPYTTGWRLIVGTTYFPDPNHPQTFMYPEDGSYTTELANSFPLSAFYELQTNIPIWTNTHYFWRIDQMNDDCAVTGETWGFTTHLNVPRNLEVYDPWLEDFATDANVFEEDPVVLRWIPILDGPVQEDRTYRYYYIYQDGVKIGETTVNDVNETSFVIPANTLAYNYPYYYTFNVTAVYDEGESDFSNPVTVRVSGRGNVSGYVYEQDGETPITGATVTFIGTDEFGHPQAFEFETGVNGYYEGTMYAGEYNGQASMGGYQIATEPTCGNPVYIFHDLTTSPVNFILDETFDPVCCVLAEYYPIDDVEYVRVSWGCGMPGEPLIEDFETGDFSKFPWENTSNYPWTVVQESQDGSYCMKSGNAGVLSSTSSIQVTLNIPYDGNFSFDLWSRGESATDTYDWDVSRFYIDGQQMFQYGKHNAWETYNMPITAGTHTFKWEYKKDSSVNPEGDCFMVDNIVFYSSTRGETAAAPTRSFHHYRVYRTNCYNDGVYTPENTMVLSCEVTDTVYVDTYWADPELTPPGVYKWGVGVVYEGNRGEEIAGPITWAAPMAVNKGENANATFSGERVNHSFAAGDRDGWLQYYTGSTMDVALGLSSGTGNFFWGIMFPAGSYSANSLTKVSYYNNDSFNGEVYICQGGDNAPGTIVYTQPFSTSAEGMMEIEMNEPVDIDATQNLWVVFHNLNGGYVATYTDDYAGVENGSWISTDGAEWYSSVYEATGGYYDGNWLIAAYVEDDGSGPAPTPSGAMLTFDFENNGEIPTGWDYNGMSYPVIPSDYPWVVWNNNPHSGTSCLASSNNGVDGSLSYTEVEVSFDGVGSIEFYSRISSEAGWDKGHFFIDGVEKLTESGTVNWTAHTYTVTPGTHTFTWAYTKDGSYSSGEDRYYIDDVTFVGCASTFALQEPRESTIVWSNEEYCHGTCLDKDMYLYDMVSVNVLLNSADSPEGITVKFTNVNEAEQNNHPIDPLILDETGFYLFPEFRKGDYYVAIDREGYYPIFDTVSIWTPTELRYVMIEILTPIPNLYVSSTGWAMWDDMDLSNPSGPASGNADTFSFDCDGGMPEGWTTIDNDGDGLTWVSSMNPGVYHNSGVDLTGTGHNGSAQYVISGSYANQTGEALTPDNYLVSPLVNIANGSTFSFWACAQDANYAAEHFGVAISDDGANWTMVNEWTLTAKGGNGVRSYGRDGSNRAQGNWYQKTVDLSAYAGQKYIAIRHFNCTDQFILNVDDIELTAGRADDRHFEYYKVMCESLDHEPIFNANTEHNFCQVATDNLIPYENYICKVAAIYTTGQQVDSLGEHWTECVWQYIPCENYAGTVNGVEVDGNTISWIYPAGGDTPTPPTPGDNVTIVLNVPGDPWGDGTGYQLILDADHNQYGNQIPASGNFTAGNFDEFEYTIPENAVCDTYTNTIVINGSASITIPAGVYDYAFLNPYPGGPYYISSDSGDFPGRGDDYEFLGGKTYTFTVTVDNYDQIGLVITDGTGKGIGRACNKPVVVNNIGCRVNANYVAPELSFVAAGAVNNGNVINNTGNRDGVLTYDYTGVYYNAIGLTSGGEFSWANMHPASEVAAYNGQSLNKVSMYLDDNQALSGNIEIYQGGATEPGTLVYTQPFALPASSAAYYDVDLTTPVVVDGSQNLWVVVTATSYTAYPASMTDFQGNTNGSWLYLEGYGWMLLDDVGFSGTWMLKAYVVEGTPAPTPGETACIGAMIFADGEWVDFVAAPTNTYTYEGDAEQVCVRMVYDGTANLPTGNIYYSMSCPECLDWNAEPYCAPGDPIRAEYVWNDDESYGALISWGEQIIPVEDWLFYDDGTNLDAIGLNGGGSFYWGIKIPAAVLADYAGCSVTKIAYYVNEATNGTVRIYNGSNGNAPGSLIGTYDYSATTTDDWVEWNIPAVAFNASQDLWIVMNNATGQYVASMCDYTGDPNGTMLSIDGSEWYTLSDATGGQYNGTWNLRCFVTNQAKGGEVKAIDVPGHGSNANATLVNAGRRHGNSHAFIPMRSNLVSYNIYRATEAAGPYSLIGNVPAAAGQTYYEYFDEVAPGTYYYQVTAVYEDPDCESEPALAEGSANNYVIVEVTSIGENNNEVALYPNPTSGNVKIEAKGMNHITVISVLGQVVYDAEVNGDELELNMGQYNAGVYMVRIATENGVSTQRVTVVR